MVIDLFARVRPFNKKAFTQITNDKFVNSSYISVREIIVLKNESFRRCINALPKNVNISRWLTFMWCFRRQYLTGYRQLFYKPLSTNHCIAILYFTQKIELSPRWMPSGDTDNRIIPLYCQVWIITTKLDQNNTFILEV